MQNVRKVIYVTFIGFFLVIGGWLVIIYVSACGFSLSCNQAAPIVERTSIPSLVPATLPAFQSPSIQPSVTPASTEESGATGIARPSNPGGPGMAIQLTGNADSGKEIYTANCTSCHGAEGKGGDPNPGSADGTVPALNPIDPTLVNANHELFATNIDLFIEHGSTPPGSVPNLFMPAWGDNGALTPQQIADVIAYIISLNK